VTRQTNWVPTSVDLEKPSAARVYDYLLGGNHNFAVDREFVAELVKVQPEAKRLAVNNRAFMRRAVMFMIDQGIRQFLDLGSGIPTVGNVHEIAQEADPTSRVVYVDFEHVAVAHSQLLLQGNENAAMVQADVTKPSMALRDEQTRRLLDFDQPIGLLAITIGHYILEDQDPYGVFADYRDALAPGSYLAITHFTDDFNEIHGDELVAQMAKTQNNVCYRSKAEVMRLFGDFELVEPGLVTCSSWRPERESMIETPDKDGFYSGVARKLR
jgi:S-adenosyl methyltransferase